MVSGLTVNRKDVYQTIDLQEWTGVDLSARPELLIYIGQRIVDRIVDRTKKDNLDNALKPLAKYSESYKKSEEFIAYGKSSSVDMSLTEGMLDSIDFSISGNEIKVFFDDPDEADKAYGHMTGMKGHKFLDGKTPKREFFGISRDDFDSNIMPEVQGDLPSPQSSSELTIGDLFSNSQGANNFNDIFGDLFNEEF